MVKVKTPKRGHCYECGKFRATRYFNIRKRSATGLDHICKDCKRDKRVGVSQAHRHPYFRRFRAEKRDKLDALKKSLGCSTCRESDPCCLQFHHEDPSQKDRSISRLYSGTWSWARVQQEINKCMVLCANCHLKLHRKEDNEKRIA